MKLNNSSEILDVLDNIIHTETQKHDLRVDLTLSEVHKMTGSGSLDFGGSEYKKAPTEIIRPQKRQPDDDYGWWSLSGGTYIAICNESLDLSNDSVAVTAPHPHSLNAGLFINTALIDSDAVADGKTINLLIQIPQAGCNIKENARFASLYLISE